MKYYGYLAVLAATLLILTACKKDDENKPAELTLELRTTPQMLLANIDSSYTYEAILNGDISTVDSVQCDITVDPSGTIPGFALFDDGGTGVLWGPDYAEHTSHDIAPNNGKFTRKISGQMLAGIVPGGSGTLHFTFTPKGSGITVQPQTITVTLAEIDTCLIRTATPIPALTECNPDFNIDLFAHADGPDLIDTVRFQILRGGNIMAEKLLAPVSSDTAWRAQITPAFIRCLPTGTDYSYNYEVKTRFGLICTSNGTGLELHNMLPLLLNSTLPDTIFRPVALGDTDTVVVTLNLEDCELAGATDFFGLHFDVRRDTAQTWTPNSAFFLRDDGLSPDHIAGNGVYTVGLTFNRSDALPNNLFYFRFYAIDGFIPGCVPFDTSAYFIDSVRVIQPDALFAPPPSSDAPAFGIVQPQISTLL